MSADGLDDGMDDDLSSGTQPDTEPAQQPIKGVGAKKGPKLARSRKKQSVTISNKVSNKGGAPTKVSPSTKGA